MVLVEEVECKELILNENFVEEILFEKVELKVLDVDSVFESSSIELSLDVLVEVENKVVDLVVFENVVVDVMELMIESVSFLFVDE